MSRIESYKNGIAGTHNKMIVLDNECCCPFIYGITAENYIVKRKMLCA
jgi:hypothetical protein